jgi:hypothetical protein
MSAGKKKFIFCVVNELPKKRPFIADRGRAIADNPTVQFPLKKELQLQTTQRGDSTTNDDIESEEKTYVSIE